MGVVEILLGELEICLDHFHGAVAKQGLESVGVAAVAQKLDGEGVPEAVGVGVGDGGAGAEAVDETTQGVAAEGMTLGGQKDTAAVVAWSGALAEVASEELGGAGAEFDAALFGPFALDEEALVFEVDLVVDQVDEFAGTQAGVEEQEDDEAIAEGGGAAVGGFAFAGAGVGTGAIAGLQHGVDVGAGVVGQDGGFFGLGTVDGAQDVPVDHVLGDGPGPEGGEAGVVVQCGFVADAVLAGQETADVVGGDAGQGGIVGQEVCEFVEGGGVVAQGVPAEATGAGVEQVAVDGIGQGDLVVHVDLRSSLLLRKSVGTGVGAVRVQYT